jgi:hypothetical protein
MVGIIDSGGDSSDRPRTSASTSSSTRTSSNTTTTTATATSSSDSDKHGSAAGASGSSDSSSGATDSIYQGKQALTRLGFGPHAIGSRTVACRLMDRDGKVMLLYCNDQSNCSCLTSLLESCASCSCCSNRLI